MSRHWSKSEINYLKRFAASKRIDELAQRFETEAAEVRAKLAELKLASKEGPVVSGGDDPLVETYGRGLEALHAGRWKEAEKLLAGVAEQSDLLDLAGRARQYLAICHARQRAASEEADPFTAAVIHKNRGELDAALELCDGRDDERFLYLAASVHALAGRTADAVDSLSRAIELNETNRVHAFHDPDFAELRQQQEHAALFGLD